MTLWKPLIWALRRVTLSEKAQIRPATNCIGAKIVSLCGCKRSWGSWTRTNAYGNQNPMSYQLDDTPINDSIYGRIRTDNLFNRMKFHKPKSFGFNGKYFASKNFFTNHHTAKAVGFPLSVRKQDYGTSRTWTENRRVHVCVAFTTPWTMSSSLVTTLHPLQFTSI